MNLPNPLAPLLALFRRAKPLADGAAAGAKKPWLPRLLLAVLALAVLVGGTLVLVQLLPQLPARFWQLLGICLIAAALIWWFAAGRRRFSLQGRARKRIGDLGPGNADDEREPLARMQAAIAEAKRTIARSPEMDKGRDPLYRVPWMLVIGDDDADTSGLLRAAADVSPFPAPAADPGAVWQWWFFKNLIAIQMHPRIVCEPGARLERGLWYQALMQLAGERAQLPLNGIVLAVSIQSLLGPADALKSTATRLRRLVDEAMEHLQVRVPVYIAVTGLERLRGYPQLRATLPAEAFAQALGHVLEPAGANANALPGLLTPLLDRLHALGLTALRGQATPAQRRGIFEFFDAIRRASSGLNLLVTLLLEDNTFQRTPSWRGLYFAGGADSANPGGAFVADLFTRFLPGDQPLAGSSLRGNAGRMAVASAGVAALLGFSVYLAYGLSTARRDDTRLLASTHSACREMEDRLGNARIEWVASCGRTIEQLESAADKTLLGFGIRRADRDIGTLRQRVTEDFANLILAPYDQMLGQDIEQGHAGLEHALAIAQRLRMLEHCRGSSRWCLQHEAGGNLAFDARSRLFAPFVSADHDTARDHDNGMALFGAYLGYLRWQKKKTLDDERDRLRGQLARLMQSTQAVAPGQLKSWSQARGGGFTLADWWLPAGALVGTDTALPAIPAAYTRPAWENVVEPFLDTLPDAGVARERIDALRGQYFTDYFAAWGGLQAHFGDGLALWKGREDDLLKRAAGNDNPYALYFARLDEQVYGLPLALPVGLRWSQCWAQMKSRWLTSWRPLSGFIGDSLALWRTRIEPPPWVPALRATRLQVLAPQAPAFAQAWLRLQGPGAGQDAWHIASELFAGHGNSDKPPADDYARLLAATDKPPEGHGENFSPQDQAAWAIARGPARLLWQATATMAARTLQQRWQETVFQPLAALPPEARQGALLGPQGKLEAFVGDWLKPFVSERERTPVSVAGVTMPLAPAFVALIASGQAGPPSDAPVPAGTFTLDSPSDLSPLEEGAQGTVFELACGGQTSSIGSRGESLSDAQMQPQWSAQTCAEARIRIALPPLPTLPDAIPAAAETPTTPAPPTPAPVVGDSPRLVLLYRGKDGMARLLQDFAGGSHAFGMADFRSSYSPGQWQELQPRLVAAGFRQARVYLRIDASPQLLQAVSGAADAPRELPGQIID